MWVGLSVIVAAAVDGAAPATTNMWVGLGIIFVAGAIGGSVMAPIKYMSRWPFQNTWAVYSVWAYLILPWVVAFLTVPNLFSIYERVSTETLVICAMAGMAWGCAVVLGALSMFWIGLALSGVILMGGSTAIGSIGPLLYSHPEVFWTRAGGLIILSNAIIIVGIVLCALAGHRREQEKDPGRVERMMSADPKRFVKGVAATAVAAVLSTGFNVALLYGAEFNRLAIANGASVVNAANPQWAFTVFFGYIPNLLVSLRHLTRERMWGNYRKGGFFYWIVPALMGLTWFGGTALYGAGSNLLGPLGPIVGWPVYMAMLILGGTFWGWWTGEWALCSVRAFRLLMTGVTVMTGGMILLNFVKV
jgi:L-rhamnose-H+ transport protein